MGTEYVTIAAGGGSFAGWEAVEVKASIKDACREFSVETTERPGDFAFPPGTPVSVLATGSLLVRGYVNVYHSSGAAKQHLVRVQGRGKGQDFVDSSAEHPTGHAKNRTAGDFARELDQYGVGIIDKVKLEKIPMQQLKQGETCFRCVERYLRPEGATMMGEPDGSISITNASVAQRAGGSLQEGRNIKAWSVTLNDSRRCQKYCVKGQNRHGKGKENLRIKEEATDGAVRRKRNRIIVNETDTDQGRARKRANHEKERQAGESIRAQITTQGWRDDGGQLWTPNTLIFVEAPILLHLEQDMLIESVTFKQGKEGTTAVLGLVDPKAYQGKGGKGGGKSKAGAKSDPAYAIA